MHTDQAKHNPETCPSCQKKAHYKAEDERYEVWVTEFEKLGGSRACLSDDIRTVNSFMNDLTPERAKRRQDKAEEKAAKKFKQTATAVSVCVIVGLLAWLLKPLFT